jgi:DNA polymerase/3'-5' exonuclease PolX
LCNRTDIAGSIRRESPLVNDIEILCIPKTQIDSFQTALFSDPIPQYKPLTLFVKAVSSLGITIYGNAYGRSMQILLPEGVKLDLFIPQENDYFRQLAIRTGSHEYCSSVIAPAWKKKGWCGTSEGLRRISDCSCENNKWECVASNPEKPPVWTSEKEFFDWLEIIYTEPKKR